MHQRGADRSRMAKHRVFILPSCVCLVSPLRQCGVPDLICLRRVAACVATSHPNFLYIEVYYTIHAVLYSEQH